MSKVRIEDTGWYGTGMPQSSPGGNIGRVNERRDKKYRVVADMYEELGNGDFEIQRVTLILTDVYFRSVLEFGPEGSPFGYHNKGHYSWSKYHVTKYGRVRTLKCARSCVMPKRVSLGRRS